MLYHISSNDLVAIPAADYLQTVPICTTEFETARNCSLLAVRYWSILNWHLFWKMMFAWAAGFAAVRRCLQTEVPVSTCSSEV